MLADSLLPIQFWAEAVNTACYVLNRVLVTKPQLKTPYELLMGRSPNISFMRPFGCPLTILNTLDHLGKFDGKSEEGYLLGYSTNSKGKENYADSKEQGISCDDVEDKDDQQFIVHTTQSMPPEERTAAKEVTLSSEDQALHDELVSLMHQESLAKDHNDDQRIAFEEEKRRISIAKGKEHVDSTFNLSTANTPPQSTGNTPTDSDDDTPTRCVFSTNSFDAEEGGVADYNNLDPTIDVPSTPTLRIHKIHPQSQIIGKSTAGVQTRRKLQDSTSNQHQALLSFIYKQNRTNHKDQQTCLFACFLSQEEPKKVSQALADESWVEAMQEERHSIQAQEVWCLCEPTKGKRVIGTKWVFRNKRDERGTIIKNKARLVAQGYRQEEGVDYDEANITEECSQQPPGFEDPAHPNRSYSLKALYSLQQPKTWSMIGWLCTYCSRPDLMFAVCTVCKISSPPKVSHLHAVKRIFRYLKHQPNLGLWYPKDSPFHLEAFSDSDYAGDNHDRRSNQRMSKSWQKLVSLAMHETNNCAISTTKQNMYSCSFVLSFVGCKINTDFWI
ncbi:zinc finger, CCHC-type containing protein [Tanacetum coccineum]